MFLSTLRDFAEAQIQSYTNAAEAQAEADARRYTNNCVIKKRPTISGGWTLDCYRSISITWEQASFLNRFYISIDDLTPIGMPTLNVSTYNEDFNTGISEDTTPEDLAEEMREVLAEDLANKVAEAQGWLFSCDDPEDPADEETYAEAEEALAEAEEALADFDADLFEVACAVLEVFKGLAGYAYEEEARFGVLSEVDSLAADATYTIDAEDLNGDSLWALGALGFISYNGGVYLHFHAPDGEARDIRTAYSLKEATREEIEKEVLDFAFDLLFDLCLQQL